jgi:hypothetical protein
MNITNEQLGQLANIYNALLNVRINGDDMFILADAMRALKQTVIQIKEQNENKEVKE